MQIDLAQYPETVEAFGGNEQRATVFLDRYSMKNTEGTPIETSPDMMWARVGVGIGKDPAQREKFYNLLKDFKFVPGGRILAGAGTESEVTYYNCYVIPVETRNRRENRAFEGDPEYENRIDPGSDSREAIIDTIGLMVEIMSRGGGVGINWSVLRPKGAHLKRINGTTSGPVSWMQVASEAVGVVEQGGSRRGAAMFMLDDWHPDLMEFIDAKRNLKVITNANVSVAVSDDFMAAVETGGDWVFEFPDTSDDKYNSEWDGDLVGWKARGGRTKTYGSHPAREVWRRLSEAAWASGEPGVVFLSRYNALSTGQGVERIISVNPCGEQGLGPYSVCNLGAMNLAAYVVPGLHQNQSEAKFDWIKFSADCAHAIEFLDRVIDTNYYFIPENEEIQKKLRRIGLGVLGLADALILQGIRYGSQEAVQFTERVFRTMKQAAVSRSSFLARDLGVAPGWNKDMIRSPYLAGYIGSPVGENMLKYGLRNLFLLTQAPTGTTSLLAGVNSGIEPYFNFEYTRKDRTGTHRVIAPVLEKLGESATKRDYLVTSRDVTVEEHIAMQAAAQKYIDSSVSKTINGPEDHTVEDVEKAYTLAYKTGCKGVAYFRDNSGRDQVLYHEVPELTNENVAAMDEIERKEKVIVKLQEQLSEVTPHAVRFIRPTALSGKTVKAKTKAGTAYITVNSDGDRPVEMFVNVGKAGSDIMELGEAIGRLASLALQQGADIEDVAGQLLGIGGNGKFNRPLPHAIGEALLTNSDPVVVPEPEDTWEDEGGSLYQPDPATIQPVTAMGPDFERVYESSNGKACPECHNFSVVREEGCEKCHLCGWSGC